MEAAGSWATKTLKMEVRKLLDYISPGGGGSKLLDYSDPEEGGSNKLL
jgi:hypothetical protein